MRNACYGTNCTQTRRLLRTKKFEDRWGCVEFALASQIIVCSKKSWRNHKIERTTTIISKKCIRIYETKINYWNVCSCNFVGKKLNAPHCWLYSLSTYIILALFGICVFMYPRHPRLFARIYVSFSHIASI